MIVIQSWSITKGQPYKEKNKNYLENKWVWVDKQFLYFHGAKNTEYSFYIVNSSASVHSSFGIPSDYHYFYGIIYYDPACRYGDADLNVFTSTHLNIKKTKDFSLFNNVEMKFKTDSNGNFTFWVVNCMWTGHSSDLTIYIYLDKYPQHQLIFHNYLPNTN